MELIEQTENCVLIRLSSRLHPGNYSLLWFDLDTYSPVKREDYEDARFSHNWEFGEPIKVDGITFSMLAVRYNSEGEKERVIRYSEIITAMSGRRNDATFDEKTAVLDLPLSLKPQNSPFNLAMANLSQGNTWQALAAIDRAIRESPQKSAYYLARAEILASQSRTTEATEMLRRALEIEPESRYLKKKLARRLATSQKTHAEAIGLYEQLIKESEYLHQKTYYNGQLEHLHINRGQLKEALESWRNLTGGGLSEQELHFKLAAVYGRANHRRKAIEEYKLAGELGADVTRYLADAYRRSKEFDKAAEEYEKLVARGKGYVSSLMRTYEQLYDYDATFEKAKKLMKKYPDRVDVYAELIGYFRDSEEGLKVEKLALDKFGDDFDIVFGIAKRHQYKNRKRALQLCKKLLDKNLSPGQRLKVLEYIPEFLGNTQESTQFNGQVIAEFPESRQALNAHESISWRHRAYGEWDEAIAEYERALEDFPGETKRLAGSLLEIQTQRRDWQDALKIATRVLKEFPDDEWTFTQLGFIYWNLKEYDKAREYFLSALREQAMMSEHSAKNKYIREFMRRRKFRGMMEEEILKRIDENAQEISWYLTSALFYLYTGQKDKAVKQYGLTLGKFTADAKLRGVVADVLFRMKRYNEALEEYLVAYEFNPKDFWKRIGECYLRLGGKAEAVKWWEKSLEYASPEDGYKGLGDIYTSHKLHEKALEAYRKARLYGFNPARYSHLIGNSLQSLRQYDEAIHEYLNVQGDYYGWRSYQNIVQICQSTKRYDTTIVLVKEKLKNAQRRDDRLFLRKLLGDLHWAMGDEEKAIREYNKLIDMARRSDESLLREIASQYNARERFADEIRVRKIILSKSARKDFADFRNLADAYAANSQPTKAFEIYRAFLKQAGENWAHDSSLKEVINIYNQNPEAIAKPHLESVMEEHLRWWLNTRQISLYFHNHIFWNAIGKMGIRDKLIQICNEYAKQYPDDALPHLFLARMYRQAIPLLPKADEEYELALKGKHISLYGKRQMFSDLVERYVQQRQRDKAIAAQKAKMELLSDANDYLKLGELYAKKGDMENAEANWQTAIDIAAFDAYNLHANLAQHYLTYNLPEKSVEQYRLAIELYPPEGYKYQLREFYSGLGEAYERLGRYEEAGEAYLKALEFESTPNILHTERMSLVKSLVEMYLKTANIKEIQEKYQAQLKKNPRNLNSRLILGNIYKARENYGDAAEQYFEALKLLPNNNNKIIEEMKEMLRQSEDAQRAIQIAKAAIPFLSVDDFRLYGLLEDLYRKTGDLQESLRTQSLVVERNPGVSDAHSHFAYFCFCEKFDELAVKEYKRAIELNDERTDLYIKLARVYYVLGRDREAEEVCLQRLAKGWSKTRDEAHFRMKFGELYEKMDNPKKAVEQYQRVLKLNFDEPWTKSDAQSRISRIKKR